MSIEASQIGDVSAIADQRKKASRIQRKTESKEKEEKRQADCLNIAGVWSSAGLPHDPLPLGSNSQTYVTRLLVGCIPSPEGPTDTSLGFLATVISTNSQALLRRPSSCADRTLALTSRGALR